MFQNDWFMREIANLSDGLAVIMTKKNRPKLEVEIKQTVLDKNRLWNELISLVEDGKIDQAENLLFSKIGMVSYNLPEIAGRFYEHLESLSDDCLRENNFLRHEIKQGSMEFLEEWKKLISR
jgi:hypothetical protein